MVVKSGYLLVLFFFAAPAFAPTLTSGISVLRQARKMRRSRKREKE